MCSRWTDHTVVPPPRRSAPSCSRNASKSVDLALGHELARQSTTQPAQRAVEGVVDAQPRAVTPGRDQHQVVAVEREGTLNLTRAGPLVKAELLAVRLGIDAERSEDWPALLKGLEPSRYHGAFAFGYARWWMAESIDWWQRDVNADSLPQRLDAAHRVELLKAATGLSRLVAIEATADSPGLRPWHLCAESRRPVDPSEGFPMLPIYGMETWQDTEYLCLEEALRRPHDARLSPSERARIAAALRRRRAA